MIISNDNSVVLDTFTIDATAPPSYEPARRPQDFALTDEGNPNVD